MIQLIGGITLVMKVFDLMTANEKVWEELARTPAKEFDPFSKTYYKRKK